MEIIEHFLGLLEILKKLKETGKPFSFLDVTKILGNNLRDADNILEYLYLKKLIKPTQTAYVSMTHSDFVLVPESLAKMIKAVEEALARLKN